MIQFKNIGQRQATITVVCPNCKKSFEQSLSRLPYPISEARNEIDSERFNEITIICPHCHEKMEGEVFATRESFYVVIEGQEDNDIKPIPVEKETPKRNKFYALLTWQNAYNSCLQLKNAEPGNDKNSDIKSLAQKYLANLTMFISSKDVYPSQRNKLEDLDEIVNEFIYRNWKALNSLDDSIDIVSVLNKFLEQTEQIMNKWYEDEMSLLLKKYIM